MTENEESWDFYFGRGGAGNRKRKMSKVNSLLKTLAPRYMRLSQTEKRFFAKNEVYDTVIKNGGSFFNIINKEAVDVTGDVDESITRIMQHLRDLNKHSKVARPTPGLTQAVASQKSTKTISMTKETMPSSIIPPPRPKRRCVKPSVVEVPAMQCVRHALKVSKMETIRLKSNEKFQGEQSAVIINSNGSSRTPTQQRSPGRLATNDAFETLEVEPPKLEESFSALIMADEITSELPTDTQMNVNQNLHKRVQRLENLVGMIMQQKDENLGPLL